MKPGGHCCAWQPSSRAQQVAQESEGEAAVPSTAATTPAASSPCRAAMASAGGWGGWGWTFPVEQQHPLEDNVAFSKTAAHLPRGDRDTPGTSQETMRFFTGAKVGIRQ